MGTLKLISVTVTVLASNPADAMDVTAALLVADPAGYDQQPVVLVGTAADVKEAGGYTTFRLEDDPHRGASIGVFCAGQPQIADGDHVRVDGIFEREHRAGEEVFSNVVDVGSVEYGQIRESTFGAQ